MGADLEGARLNRLGERLLLRLLDGAREVVAQLLELGVGGPAEPGSVAGGAEGRVRQRMPDGLGLERQAVARRALQSSKGSERTKFARVA